MEVRHRRWVGRLVRIGLVVAALAIVWAWWFRGRSPVRSDFRIQSESPTAEALGPGDMRIYNRDSTVSLVLQGPNVLAGLSPQTVDRIRGELEQSTARDTAGLGGSIAQLVKKTVASAIESHVVYPVRDMRDIVYENGQIVIVRHDGRRIELFGNVEVDKTKVGRSFEPADAQRFVNAVRARLSAPGSF